MAHPDPAVLLAQRLAGNEKKIRDRAVRKLRRYLRARSAAESGGFTEDEFTKIWKGLFYCLWMQDKPLLQEQLANTTSQLIYALHTRQSQQLFIKTFWQTLSREWNGIDRLRLDKFYTLARLVLRRSVELLRKAEWEESHVGEFLALLTQEVLLGGARGVQFHLIDMYLDELAQVGAAELPADLNIKLIEPFCKMAAKSKDLLLLQAVLSGIFQVILDQAPFAIEDLMKELKGTPGDSDSDSPESTETFRQDAEDVGPVLQFDYTALAERLFTLASKTYTPAHNRKRLYRLVKQFQDLAEGDFPQDDLPEEVSTDEDDDEFSSWRFRKRQKRAQAREAEMSNPAEEMNEVQKRQKRKKEDFANSTDVPEPPDSFAPAPAKKKLKKAAEINSIEETPLPAVNGEMIEPLKIPDLEPPGTESEFISPPSSTLKMKMKKRRRTSLLRQRMGFTTPEQEVVAEVSETSIKAGGTSKATLKAGDAPKATLKAGDAPKATLKAGDAPTATLKPGDAPMATLKPGDAPKATLKAGDAPKATLKVGDAPKATLKVGDAPKATLKVGDAPKATLKVGDAPKATLKVGDAPKATLKVGDAPKATLKVGDAPKATLKVGGAPKATLKAGAAPKATLKAGAAPKATLKAGAAPKATLKAGAAPKATLKAGGAPKATLKTVDAPKATLKTVDAPKATLKAVDAPKATLKAVDAPKATLKAVDAPKATLKAVDAPKATLKAVDAPKATLKAVDAPKATLKAGDAPKATLKAGDAPKAQKKAAKIQAKVHMKSNINSKKVTFSLTQNMTAEFKRTDRSLLVSPTGSFRVPFNPEQKPQHGVLKTPVKSTRPRAADFF